MSTATDSMKLADNGKPFKSEEEAKRTMTNANMSEDVWGVCRFEEGWAIAKQSWIVSRLREEAKEHDEAVRAVNTKKLGYRFIKIAGHSNPNEYGKVPIGVGGMILWVTRNIKVPLPENYVQVLRDAIQKQFEPSDNPEVPYKEAGSMHRYPFEDLGPATEEDFKRVFEQQRVDTQEAVRTAGMKK